MDSIQDVVAVGGAILSIAVTWGVLKTKIAGLEKTLQDRRDVLTDMEQAFQRSRHDLINQVQIIKLDQLKQRTEIQETFVTWKQFESFVAQIRAEQAEIKSDVKHILEILANLSAKK